MRIDGDGKAIYELTTDDAGGQREITLVIYADPTVEREHDARFGVE